MIQLFPSHLLLNNLNMIYLYIMKVWYVIAALQSKNIIINKFWTYLKSRPPNINMQAFLHGYNKGII